MAVNACFGKDLPLGPSPDDFYFKGKGDLATHSLRYLQQGVFGHRESEGKWEKMREKPKLL